jgi:hypothetical protein
MTRPRVKPVGRQTLLKGTIPEINPGLCQKANGKQGYNILVFVNAGWVTANEVRIK